MSEWQTIETAPRDGTKMILFTNWLGDACLGPFTEIQIGFFEGDHGDPSEWFYREAGWRTEKIGDPTHWMPLPLPPRSSTPNKGE